MKAFNFLILVTCLKTRVKAQFHDVTGLEKQKNAKIKEDTARRVQENWELNLMVVSTMQMQEREVKKAQERSKELGETTDPFGNTVPGNERPIIRQLDPRTPKTFGNLFLRSEVVEEKMEEVFDNLTDEEKELIESLTEDGEEELYEESEEMMLINAPPRGICGKDRDDAETRCGNTCDPEIPYCVRFAENSEENHVRVGGAGQWKYFDKCFADVICSEPSSSEVLEMASEGGDCAPLRMNNPCPNPCDCYKSKNKKQKCKKACQQTDNKNILACARMKIKGDKKRRSKTIDHLELNKNACDFNVYFNHALQDNQSISGVKLPGLFGTH